MQTQPTAPCAGHRDSNHRTCTLALLSAAAAILVLAQSTTASAAAADAAPRITELKAATISIPPCTLAEALNTLAKQTGADLVYRPDQVAGLTTPGIHGELTIADAIGQLLKGTELHLSTNAAGAYLIATPKPTASSSRAEERVGDEGLLRVARGENESQIDSSQKTASAAASKDSEASGSKIEEIVVTAQKRTERLIDVPISITALNGRELDRSTDRSVAEALSRVPGVVTAMASSNTRVGNTGGQVVIRGVSAVQANNAGASTTAYYLDSIPFGFVRSSYAPDASAYDMERVEVLRGPQGTLYGLSALNGVVRVLTKDADLNKFEFKARASTSSTEASSTMNYRGDMAVNVPVIDGKLAIRAVAGYQDWGGWIDKPVLNRKDANDSQIGNYRLKVNAQPTEQLSIGLSAWLSRSDMSQPPTSPDDRVSRSAFEEPSYLDYDAYGLKIGYDFASFAVSGMTSYIDFSNHGGSDYTAVVPTERSILEINSDNSVFSQEVIVNSKQAGPWQWSFGGMYRDGKDKTVIFRSQYQAPGDVGSFSKSFAVFGETTRAFLDGRLELTGGLRYFHDRVSDTERSRSFFSVNPSTGLPILAPDSTNTFTKTTPRLVLTWHPAEQATLYVSYAEGFRSGMNQFTTTRTQAPQYPAVKPDDLKNYEIGAKWSLWGGRINFDTAVFFEDWQGVQQNIGVVFPPGSPVPTGGALINANSASGGGFEFGVWAEPVDGLTVAGNFSWNDLRVDRTVVDVNNVVQFTKGNRLYLSPEYTASASADYKFPLGGGNLSGRVSASANYISEMLSGAAFFASIPRPTVEPTLMARAGVGIESADHWAGTLYVDNLMNEKALTLDSFSPVWNVGVRPRTIGLQLEYRY